MTENTAPDGISPAGPAGPGALERAPRRQRADAQRNTVSLLEAAKSRPGNDLRAGLAGV